MDFFIKNVGALEFFHILSICIGAIILYWMVVFFTARFLKFLLQVQRNRQDSEARMRTISTVVRSSGYFVILLLALVMILKELKIDTTPILASAGVLGLAISFGAQTLIKDVLAGLFILTEDQYREGDEVKLDELQGIVKKITLRRTVLESENSLHTIPNGTIKIASLILSKRKK